MRTRRFGLLPSVIAVAALAAGCSSAATLAPSTQPDPSSAPPSVAAVASPNASSTAPPLTETFTSTMHGISAAHPAGWTVQAATEPWTTVEWSFEDPKLDILYEPTLPGHLFLGLGSASLGATGADQWVTDRMAAYECSATEAVTVDGATGSICADGALALVSTGGRGYMIALYTSGDEGWLDDVYDRAWFEDLLATVDLRPDDAVDFAPSPSP